MKKTDAPTISFGKDKEGDRVYHQTDVVVSDTQKAIPLLRKGGVILWHDYCLNEAVKKKYPHVISVIKGVDSVSKELSQAEVDLYWIDPGWLLLGIKKSS